MAFPCVPVRHWRRLPAAGSVCRAVCTVAGLCQLWACGAADGERRAPNGSTAEVRMEFTLSSPAFAPGGAIPAQYTCDGADRAPALQWSGVPAGTQSLALVVDDPDAPDPRAPKTTWVHWVLYNLPPAAAGLPEGGTPLPAGTREGRNDWRRTGWGGPCPPVGRHRYFFKLYALDAVLPDLGAATKAELEQALQPHLLGRAELMGTYARRR